MSETEATHPGTLPILLPASEVESPVDLTVARAKLAHARALVRALDSVVVAFSGGVDSTLVLKVALEALGQRAMAVTAVSASLPAGELAAAEAGLAKAEVRALSRAFGLPTWDKPSMACLSSRIPYGRPVTRQALSQIDRAERAVRALGIRQVRVRHHDKLARIEIDPADFAVVFAQRETIVRGLRELGYDDVTLDLLGYRTGSLNEARR